MKNKRLQNIALGLAFVLPILGVYVGRKLLSKAKTKTTGTIPEVTRIRIPLSSLIGISQNEVAQQPQAKIVLPEVQVDTSSEEELREETVEAVYIASTERGVFHSPDCRWAKNIKPDNKIHLNTKDEAIERGYTPCNTCNP